MRLWSIYHANRKFQARSLLLVVLVGFGMLQNFIGMTGVTSSDSLDGPELDTIKCGLPERCVQKFPVLIL